MEQRRWEETDPQTLKGFRRGWCLGSKEFKQRMLQLMEGRLGENHSGEQRRESPEAKAERIIAEELLRLGCSDADLRPLRKCDAQKLAVAARVRRETTLSVKRIAARLNLGTPRNATVRLQEWRRQSQAKGPGRK